MGAIEELARLKAAVPEAEKRVAAVTADLQQRRRKAAAARAELDAYRYEVGLGEEPSGDAERDHQLVEKCRHAEAGIPEGAEKVIEGAKAALDKCIAEVPRYATEHLIELIEERAARAVQVGRHRQRAIDNLIAADREWKAEQGQWRRLLRLAEGDPNARRLLDDIDEDVLLRHRVPLPEWSIENWPCPKSVAEFSGEGEAA